MNELNDLMQSEYDAVVAMDTPTSELVSNALKAVRAKLTKEEYLKIEEDIFNGYVYAEKFGFEQGFMRGIVVVKGGVAV